MFNLQEAIGLSDEGYRNFKRAVFAVVLTNFTMLIPFVVIVQTIIALLEPLYTGRPLDTARLWLLTGTGFAAAVLYFFVYRSEYRKTYTVAYQETEKIRLEVAEHIRRLPLSFFNNKDLSELTANMMADCTSIEHTMSHVAPGLFANIITITITCALLALYDWRLSLALFVALPLAFGLILGTRKLQRFFGERHVLAKLDVSDQTQEYLEGIKVIKAFNLAGEKFTRLEQSLKTMMTESIKFEGIAGIFITLAMMILQVGIGLVTLVGVMLLASGGVDAIKLLVFVIISAKIYSPLVVLLTLLPEFFYTLLATKRMQMLRKEPPMQGDENVSLPNYDIELDNVSFAYNNDDVIQNLSLRIPQHGITALVGP
jgi:ATP-binding cassette subfamily B protein